MAIDIWTQNTAANSTLQGGMALASGVGGGIQALGDNITKAIEKRKSEASLANTLRKKLSILHPERKDEFTVMGLPDLTGEDLGHAEKILNARHEQEAQAGRLRMDFDKMRLAQEPDAFRQRMALGDQRLRGEQALEGFAKDFSGAEPGVETLQDYFENGDGTMPMPKASEADRLRHALSRNPAAAAAPQFDNTVQALSRALMNKKSVVLPPGFVPKSATVDGVTYGNPRDEKPMLEDHPWLYDDDMEKVKTGIRGIKDPQQRALAITARNDYEVMQGRPGLLEKLLMGDMGSGGAKPNKPSPDGPGAGDVEDGYRFKGGNRADPKNWEKVK